MSHLSESLGTFGRRLGRRAPARGSLPVAFVIAATGVALLGSAIADASAIDDRRSARSGSAWLSAQLTATTPLTIAGFADWPLTVQAGLALASTGAPASTTDPLWNAVAANREASVVRSGVDVPGRLGFVVLLAGALGKDPHAVGAGPGADLVARLTATRRTSGADAGLFGSQAPNFDGAFRQGYSILGLVAAGVAPDPSSLDWLTRQQCPSGGWAGYRSDTSVICAATGSTAADSNSTALALSALLAAGRPPTDPAVVAGLEWLDGHQMADGGWRLTEVSATSDPNSTAIVIQALVAAGAVDEARFADHGSPFDALRSFQLGCAAAVADRGAFSYPGANGAPNSLATVQAVAAMARVTYPIGQGEARPDDGSILDCSAPTTSTVPSEVVPTTAPTTTAPTTTAPTTSTTVADGAGQTTTTTTVAAAATTTATSTTTTTVAAAATTTAPPAGVEPSAPAASVEAATATRAPGSLAVTGGSSGRLAVIGGVLLLAGSALIALGRRRS